jgi:hypothetical protein
MGNADNISYPLCVNLHYFVIQKIAQRFKTTHHFPVNESKTGFLKEGR